MNIIHKIIIISILFFGVFCNINAQKNNEFACIDLGLPSGNLWAANNIGGNQDYAGNKYAWGETSYKSYFYWYHDSGYSYKYGVQSLAIIKYCGNPALGYQGYFDNLTVLQLEDDAATVNWGEDWHIPTYEDWIELISNCTIRIVHEEEYNPNSHITYINGGRPMIWKVTGKNGNSISLNFSECGYWSSSLNPKVPHSAWCFALGHNGSGMYYCLRSEGRHIRPVRSGKPSTPNNQPLDMATYTTSHQSSTTGLSNTSNDFVNTKDRVVVIDGSKLRLRLGPSTSSDTFKWPDGTNRHPNVGDKFKYLGESGDFYKIDFNGNELWVSKQFSHIE